MKIFKDNEGKTWTISITIGAAKRVRDLCNVNLFDLKEVSERLGGDTILLCDVLYTLVKPEADKLGISDIEFGERLGGDTIDSASQAFLDELIDSYPKAKRQILRKLINKVETSQQAEIEIVLKKIDNLSIETTQVESGN